MSQENHIKNGREVSYFAPGPSKIFPEIMDELQSDLLEYEDSGISILEVSHRTERYEKLNRKVQMQIREMLEVPENYKILFLHGGAQGQFSGVPLNLMSRTGKADYVVAGSWAAKAAKEAEKYGKVNWVTPKQEKYTYILPNDQWKFSPDASYVYFCSNETAESIEFHFDPKVPDGIPLVCDMTSNIFTKPFDIKKYGLVYASSGKNMGCVGVTIVIIREDLLGHAHPMCPSILDYSALDKVSSIFNTPPILPVYMLGRALEWIKKNGGLEGMNKRSLARSREVYSIIDSSRGFYRCSADPSCRSRLNVAFRVGLPKPDEALEKKFIKTAEDEGLLFLKGHRWVGGIRASIYNAITMRDIERLCDFMTRFQGANKTN